MSKDECYMFVVSNGVNIPNSMDDVSSVKDLIKSIIITIEKNPTHTFNYNFIDTAKFAEEVKSLVIEYYGLEDYSSIVNTSLRSYYELQDSYVYGDGEWKSYGGDYKTKWYSYNCYAYAIGRTESPVNYGEYYEQYQPGIFSGNGSFYYSMDIEDLAQLVCDDLSSLGMTNINVSNEIPSVLNNDYKMICVRKSPNDYHFMKYDIQTDSWYHKPGRSAVLRYKFIPQNNYTWTNEASIYGVEYAPDQLYASDIQYITYQMPKIELNYNTTNLCFDKNIQQGKDIMFEIVVNYEKNYTIQFSSAYSNNVFLYDCDMDLINSITDVVDGENINSMILDNLSVGIYYLRIDFVDNHVFGEIMVQVFSDEGNYLNINNTCIIDEKNILVNNYRTGLYKITLNTTCSFYGGEITVFNHQEKNAPMERLQTSLFCLDAKNSSGSNNLVVYFALGEIYFIDIASRIVNDSSANITVQLIRDEYEVDLGVTTSYIIMSEEHQMGDSFKKIDMVDNGRIIIEYEYDGSQEEMIYFVLFKGNFNEATNYYEIELVFPEMMVTYGQSLVWTSYLYDGTYYIGYFEKLNYSSSISIEIITG